MVNTIDICTLEEKCLLSLHDFCFSETDSIAPCGGAIAPAGLHTKGAQGLLMWLMLDVKFYSLRINCLTYLFCWHITLYSILGSPDSLDKIAIAKKKSSENIMWCWWTDLMSPEMLHSPPFHHADSILFLPCFHRQCLPSVTFEKAFPSVYPKDGCVLFTPHI